MECAHCGNETSGYATVGKARVCHSGHGPDCYRRVIQGEPLGILKEFEDKPEGTDDLLLGWHAWNTGDGLQAQATVCVTHMRFIPCRREAGCLISVLPADVERVRKYQAS